MKSLLMLTKFYPYGNEEAFIENEIEVLSKKFEKIVIIACEVDNKEERVRKVPNNVKTYKVISKQKKMQTIIDGIVGIKKIFNMSNEMKYEINYCNNIFKKLFLLYFEQKSNRIFSQIEQQDFLRDIKNEKFILYSYWLFTTAKVGVNLKKVLNNNIIYSFCRAHRYDLYEERNSLKYLPYRSLLLKNYDSIFPCSNDGVEYLKNKYSDYSNKIKVSFLGTLDNGLSKYSDDNIFRIVSCSRLEPVKRVNRIVEALSLIDITDKMIEWTHIGGGREFDTIKKLIDKKIKNKNIKINLLGNVPNKDVINFYKNSKVDLFINVSSSEGLPVSIMESISFGIPVIATNVGGTSEIVIDGVDGYLLSSNFENRELAKLIIKIIKAKESEEYNNMRMQSRELWEKRFQARNNYENLCTFIDLKVRKI